MQGHSREQWIEKKWRTDIREIKSDRRNNRKKDGEETEYRKLKKKRGEVSKEAPAVTLIVRRQRRVKKVCTKFYGCYQNDKSKADLTLWSVPQGEGTLERNHSPANANTLHSAASQ